MIEGVTPVSPTPPPPEQGQNLAQSTARQFTSLTLMKEGLLSLLEALKGAKGK